MAVFNTFGTTLCHLAPVCDDMFRHKLCIVHKPHLTKCLGMQYSLALNS